MASQEAKLVAAELLDSLAERMRIVASRLRNDDPDAYALTYDLRADLSRVVATLGAGIPKRKI